MTYKPNTRHLTPQQQAIIAQRDKEDKIRAEELKRKEKRSELIENEELFVRLSLWHRVGGEETEELIEKGYLTREFILTTKASDFRKRFIISKKESLYLAIKDFGEDIRGIKEKVGIKDFVALERIADELVEEGRIKKDDEGRYWIIVK